MRGERGQHRGTWCALCSSYLRRIESFCRWGVRDKGEGVDISAEGSTEMDLSALIGELRYIR